MSNGSSKLNEKQNPWYTLNEMYEVFREFDSKNKKTITESNARQYLLKYKDAKSFIEKHQLELRLDSIDLKLNDSSMGINERNRHVIQQVQIFFHNNAPHIKNEVNRLNLSEAYEDESVENSDQSRPTSVDKEVGVEKSATMDSARLNFEHADDIFNVEHAGVSERHLKEMRHRKNSLVRAGIVGWPDNLQGLFETQLKESTNIRTHSLFQALEKNKHISDATSKELIDIVSRFVDSLISVQKNIRKEDFARNSVPEDAQKAALRGVETTGNEIKRLYIRKIKLEVKRRNEELKTDHSNSAVRADTYVDLSRIRELETIQSTKFDLSRLIRLCEELNVAHQNQCFLSIPMIVRTIINHIPPVFGKNGFSEVANNYGGKSFKQSMKLLENSLKHIADTHLHQQIRKRDNLPTFTQVDFRSPLDFLLGEIIRELE